MVMNQDFTHAFEIITCGPILLALVYKFPHKIFQVLGVVQALASWMTHVLLDDHFAKHNLSCLLGLDNPHKRMGV